MKKPATPAPQTEPAQDAKVTTEQGPLQPSGTEAVSQPTTYPSAGSIAVHDSATPTPQQVEESFANLTPAEGNVLVKNLATGNVGEVNAADAQRLVNETPKDYQIL